MFRLHLHPTFSNLVFGMALIAFWALLWLWFFAQLPQLAHGAASANDSREVASSVQPSGSQPAPGKASEMGL
jgi:hypothetical protein